MRVKLLISRSGPAGAFNAGDEIDVSESEGQRLIDLGKALPTTVSKTKREKATLGKHETRGKR